MISRSRWWTATALVVIFLAGALTGWLVGLSARHPHFRPPRRDDMMAQMRARLARDLALTPQQSEKIDPLIAQTAQELDGVRRESDDRVMRLMDEMHAKMAASLTPEQVAKLGELNERRRVMMKDRREPPPGR